MPSQDEEEYIPPPSRRQRALLSHKDCLRCEWCNRWTECDHEIWAKIYAMDRDYIWYCKREQCRMERLDVMGVPK